MQVLLIKDEKNAEIAARIMLEAEGFTVSSASTACDGVALGLSGYFDLIVLDLELPDMNGHEVLISLRQNAIEAPIIVLSGHSNVVFKIKSFELGADDYIAKPFHRDEFIARIYAITRRHRHKEEEKIYFGDLTLCSVNKILQRQSEFIKLTSTEYKLIELLIKRKREIVQDELICQVMYDGRDFRNSRKTLAVHIHNLRKKLKGLGSRNYIARDWGGGYALR